MTKAENIKDDSWIPVRVKGGKFIKKQEERQWWSVPKWYRNQIKDLPVTKAGIVWAKKYIEYYWIWPKA